MTHIDYEHFLDTKRLAVRTTGPYIQGTEINEKLFEFQRSITAWALRKGRAAIFADTGLGKTFMQLEWARLLDETTLLVAPLSVARQTIREAAKLDIPVEYVRHGSEVGTGINITNYEMLAHFQDVAFGSVVLDESSILKSLDGKTRKKLNDMFADVPYKLCCTATPAPNDIAEIANHAEFLGVMSRVDMLATFFVHDDAGWRPKGHARGPFFQWLASWGMSVRTPSDIGYSDEGYILPPLDVQPTFVRTEYAPTDKLFFTGLSGIHERTQVRRATMAERIEAVVELVRHNDEQWILWHGLNDEGYALAAAIEGAVLVEGQQEPEEKAQAIEAFQDGRHRILITKPRIAGFGLNFQQCHNMAFVGLSDSWEAYYQCIRRCYRFGQEHPVKVYIILSEAEHEIYDNVMHKEKEARTMSEELVKNVAEYEREELQDRGEGTPYETSTVVGANFTLLLGDSAERLKEIKDDSLGLSVFSPPFMSLYTYSPTERDLGNSRTPEQFFSHFGYVIRELLRATMPGRNCCVHVAQVPAMLVRDGYIGLKDFRGKTIETFEGEGWVYHGEVCIDKDPQAQAIRTKSKALLFTQLHKDASWLRPALADYILVFRKPGDNAQPVIPDVSNNEWIEWARPIWYGIRESDTLNIAEAREHEDERHICPLQLGSIERCIRLWSNKGDLVCSPFAGIGSEGYEAIRLGRKFVGIELKASYFRAAQRNLQAAHARTEQPNFLDLFTAETQDREG